MGAMLIAQGAEVTDASSKMLLPDDKGKVPLEALVADPKCDALVDALCSSNPTINAAVVSPAMFSAMAKPSTAAAALRLVEEKGLEIDESLALALTTGRAPSMERIDVGHGISRTSTQAICEELGGRLAYREELYDMDTKTLLGMYSLPLPEAPSHRPILPQHAVPNAQRTTHDM